MEEGTLFLGNDKSNVIVDTVLVFLGGGRSFFLTQPSLLFLDLHR